MQSIRPSQKHMLGIFLVIGICLAFFIGLILPVHAEGTTTPIGDCSHGYVTDIAIKPAPTAKTYIPNYSFTPEEVNYNINLYNSGNPALFLSVDKDAAKDNDLFYLIKWNNALTSTTKSPRQIKASKTANLPNVLNEILTSPCGTYDLTVRVGKMSGTEWTTYDEYVYSVSVFPALTDDTLKIVDNGTSATITPAYTKGACYFGNNFATTASSETVTLTGRFRNADGKTSCYIGYSEKPVAGTTSAGKTSISEEITLSEYATDTSGISKIPVRLEYSGDKGTVSTDYFIYVMNEELAKPTITQQPKSVVCDKLDTPTLSVAATVPDGTTITYQWFYGKNVDVLYPIADATDSTYTVPKEDTSLAGSKYYRCDVTSNITIDDIGTLQFTTQSDVVSVETRLSYISAPTILKELGSFVSTRNDRFEDIYRTEYFSGEKFDLAYISVAKPEVGVRLSYEYYCNTEPDFDAAQPIDFVFGQSWEVTRDGNAHIITSAQPKEGYETGEYYIYCKVTASAKGLESASAISGPLHLTYSDIVLEGFKGSGTKADPYQISSKADLAHLREIVYNGQWCSGVQFKLMNNIELSSDWKPIGDKNADLYNPVTGRDIQAFSGVLNGNGKKITVAKGGYPLFNYVSDAVIENLDIYGEQINGNGLIDKMFADYGSDGNYWTGVPNCVTIRNVRLLEGSSTLMSGFMLGSGSGANTITIENCVVQKGVTIGYDKQQNGIGSFVGGAFNGEINNSYSEADVYGIQRIGGLAASKGQSMGLCQIVNSHFSGNLVATGDWVGGLIAKGYTDPSAPNTMAVSFINCYVDGNITGADYVGGLFGGEGGLKGCMNNCYLEDSHFYGTITATGDHVGGIIGRMESVNKYQHIENNYYYETSGKELPLIGSVGIYWYKDEAEKAAVIANMGSAKTKEEFADGTVKNLLNAGSDYENWVQANGEAYPRLSGDAVVSSLTISGSYKTRYKQGEALDLDGIVFTAVWSDGKTENPALDDVQQVTKFDPQHLGVQTITFRYGAGRASITVSVIKDYTDDDRENFGKANVTFTLTNNAYLQLANVPITVTYFDLANYGLEEYYQYDESGNVIEQPTMLHLFIAAMEHYEIGLEGDEIGRGSLRQYPDYLTVSGGSGHMYMTRFWKHNENLIYSLNGVYPLQSPGIGATADQLILHDGDFVDVAMFSDTTFYSDIESGMHYFSTDGATPQRVFTVTHDTDLKLTYLLAHTAMMGDYVTRFTPVKSQTTVYYGTSINGSDMKTMTTNENSELTISFKDPGTYYLWTQGATGSNGKAIVSAPACATIIVTLNQEEINKKLVEDVEALIDAIDEVTEDSGDAIKAAREAYDALPDELKESVTNYDKLKKAEDDYKAILNKKAAAQVEALIEAIGEVTENSGDAIKAARDAYNALTDEQKELVENYDKLEEAEVKYVEALIDAIGVVTKDSGEKIKAARDAYDALTPAQRKLVGNYKTLLAAEKRYEDLTKPVTPVEPSKPTKPSTKPTDEPAKPDASKFVDVSKNNWYFDSVQYVLENGLMNGTSANEFSPNANTTRGMIVTILARLDGVDTSGSSPWYAAGRTWAMNADVSDGTNIEGKITREQLAAMLYRYAKLKGYDVSASADISTYTDASSVSSWATDAMRWAVGAGLINGRTATTLAPQGNATRAEVAAILMRFAQKIVK